MACSPEVFHEICTEATDSGVDDPECVPEHVLDLDHDSGSDRHIPVSGRITFIQGRFGVRFSAGSVLVSNLQSSGIRDFPADHGFDRRYSGILHYCGSSRGFLGDLYFRAGQCSG